MFNYKKQEKEKSVGEKSVSSSLLGEFKDGEDGLMREEAGVAKSCSSVKDRLA
jgi:hypothetical protein